MKPKRSLPVLIFSTLSMMTAFAAWSVFAPIATEIQKIYQLSTAEKSILVAIPVLLGSLMRIPMGILTDRYGGRKIYSLTMLLLIFPLIGAGFTHSYSMLLFWAFFIGMAGTTFAISITYISKWYPPEKQGFILGIAGMGNIGSAIASFLVPMIFVTHGLSWVFWSLAISVGIMSFILWIGTQDQKLSSKPKSFKESLSVLKFKETWLLSIFYSLTFGSFVTFSIYLPTLLQEQFKLTTLDAGIKTAGFVTVATLIRPVGGYLSDRFGARRILAFVYSGVLLLGLVIAFSIENFHLFSISCFLIAISLGIGNGAVFKMVPEVSTGNIGAVTGIVGAFGGLGGFFPPIILGFFKELTDSYLLGFALLSLFSLICLFLNYTGFNKPKIQLDSKKIA
ncbi:nitrate/nitrite transporter [Bacillus sp. JJ634]